MNKKTTGQLISLAYVLHGAAESFAKAEVGNWKLRRQAERVMKNCLNAIGSVGSAVHVERDGHKEVNDALKRQAQRIKCRSFCSTQRIMSASFTMYSGLISSMPA